MLLDLISVALPISWIRDEAGTLFHCTVCTHSAVPPPISLPTLCPSCFSLHSHSDLTSRYPSMLNHSPEVCLRMVMYLHLSTQSIIQLPGDLRNRLGTTNGHLLTNLLNSRFREIKTFYKFLSLAWIQGPFPTVSWFQASYCLLHLFRSPLALTFPSLSHNSLNRTQLLNTGRVNCLEFLLDKRDSHKAWMQCTGCLSVHGKQHSEATLASPDITLDIPCNCSQDLLLG